MRVDTLTNNDSINRGRKNHFVKSYINTVEKIGNVVFCANINQITIQLYDNNKFSD